MSYAAAANRVIDNPEAYDAAVSKRIKDGANAKFHRENNDANAVLDCLYGAAGWSDFAKSLCKSYEDFGKLSVAQMDAARKMLAKQQARVQAKIDARNAPASSGHHVSTIGQRENFTLTINKLMAMDGQYGMSYLHICTDPAGNAVVYKGSAELGKQGDTVTVKATVKDHTAYNGVAQTIINRPKVL